MVAAPMDQKQEVPTVVLFNQVAAHADLTRQQTKKLKAANNADPAHTSQGLALPSSPHTQKTLQKPALENYSSSPTMMHDGKKSQG